jgi:dephospho-CoA kinase
MILGLTGGMGCGKSTAAKLFANAGFQLIDTDAIVRTEVLTDPAIIRQICEHFGSEIAPEGVIDRARLAEKVFASPEERRWLEALTHPEVRRRWREKVDQAPKERWVVEIPLLFEKDLHKLVDFTVCVACSERLQFVRLEQRGVSRMLAEQRISQQLPLARKVELSDFVLSNDGTAAFLEQQVKHLVARLSAGSLSRF